MQTWQLQGQSLAHGAQPGVWYGASLEWNNGYKTGQRCDFDGLKKLRFGRWVIFTTNLILRVGFSSFLCIGFIWDCHDVNKTLI